MFPLVIFNIITKGTHLVCIYTALFSLESEFLSLGKGEKYPTTINRTPTTINETIRGIVWSATKSRSSRIVTNPKRTAPEIQYERRFRFDPAIIYPVP